MALDLKKYTVDKMEQRFKDGIYQWFVDHSTVLNNGSLKIVAYIDGKEDFWERVSYRVRGDYARYTEREKQMKNKMTTYFIGQQKGIKKQKEIIRIDKSGNLFEKFMLWLYRKANNYLFK